MIVVVIAGAAAFTGAALGQRVISAKAGFVFFVQGRVYVDGSPLSTDERLSQLKAGELFHQLKDGQSLSTQRGRAEVLLNPGVVLRLGEMSRLRMDDVNLTDACVSLESGSAVVTVNYILKTDRIRLIAGGSVIVMKQVGVYRLDIAQGRLRVFNGRAEVQRTGSIAKAIVVKRGRAANLGDGLHIAKFNLKATDALDRWAATRSRTSAPRGFGLRPQPPRIGWLSDQPPADASQTAAPTSSNRF